MRYDNAVSPVIGVLLMLVVTIIIAAVISGFAGGLSATQSKSPQATIEGTYSQSEGMKISHTGGDTLAVLDTKILVRPTTEFGNYQHLSWLINRTVIKDSTDMDKSWDGSVSSSKKMAIFEPGMSLKINATDLNYVQETEDGSIQGNNTYYGFNTSTNVGKSFTLSLIDRNGREFAATKVAIKS